MPRLQIALLKLPFCFEIVRVLDHLRSLSPGRPLLLAGLHLALHPEVVPVSDHLRPLPWGPFPLLSVSERALHPQVVVVLHDRHPLSLDGPLLPLGGVHLALQVEVVGPPADGGPFPRGPGVDLAAGERPFHPEVVLVLHDLGPGLAPVPAAGLTPAVHDAGGGGGLLREELLPILC